MLVENLVWSYFQKVQRMRMAQHSNQEDAQAINSDRNNDSLNMVYHIVDSEIVKAMINIQSTHTNG